MKIARNYTGRQNIICFDVSWRRGARPRGLGGGGGARLRAVINGREASERGPAGQPHRAGGAVAPKPHCAPAMPELRHDPTPLDVPSSQKTQQSNPCTCNRDR
jgi:hypothetical protein